MAVWLLLNVLDVLSTYQALSTGKATEINPLMSLLIGTPLLLITAKMLLAYGAVKIVEKASARSIYYSVVSLLVLNIYVALVCANNIIVWLRK